MEKIAVIGSGISGLAVSYLLKDKYEVTLYEKNNYFGGHARTLEVNDVPVDTGFIVSKLTLSSINFSKINPHDVYFDQ